MAKSGKTTDIKNDPDLIRGTAKKIHDGVVTRADGYLDGSYDPKKAAGKALMKGGGTALLVLSLLTGLAFSNPADITEDQSNAQLRQAPIVMDIDDYANATVDDDDDEADEQKGARTGLIARFRQAVLSLPTAVRMLVIVPLWAAGTAIMTAISFLWNTLFTSPLGAFIMSFAAGFAILFGLFAVTAKMLFPELPLRKILCRRNIIMLLITALALAGADAVAPLFWHKYPAVSALVKIAAGASVIGLLSVRTKRLFHRDRYSGMPEAAF